MVIGVGVEEERAFGEGGGWEHRKEQRGKFEKSKKGKAKGEEKKWGGRERGLGEGNWWWILEVVWGMLVLWWCVGIN